MPTKKCSVLLKAEFDISETNNLRADMSYSLCCTRKSKAAFTLGARVRYLTKFGGCEQYTIDFMIYWFGNEVDRWYICLKRTLYEQQTIDQPCFQAQAPNCSQERMQKTFHARFCGFCQVFPVTLRQKTSTRTREEPLYPGNLAVYSRVN